MPESGFISFYVFNTADGRVGVTPMMPVGVQTEGPIRQFQVSGDGTLPYFKSRMTPAEFATLQESLVHEGFAVELRDCE